jgi:L-ascorbate metabolism protein UlaG (beta-lactamase superfamily)
MYTKVSVVVRFIFCFSAFILFTSFGCSTKKFKNTHINTDKNFFDFVWMRLKTSYSEWPKSVTLKFTPKIEERSDSLKIIYINHSSFLIQYKNVNILTDPVFSVRVSPTQLIGPKRVQPSGIQKELLPPIDYVLISHDHYDHLDLPFLNWLRERDRPQLIVGKRVGHIFSDKTKIVELDWWEAMSDSCCKIVFTPAQHFSGRTLWDRNTTLWGSFFVTIADVSFYFAGDTGYSPHFREIQHRLGSPHFAFIPIGAYAPREFMKVHHMNPEEANLAHKDLAANFSLGMHWGTFQLTQEEREEPKHWVEKIMSSEDKKNFIVPENGQCFEWIQQRLKSCM